MERYELLKKLSELDFLAVDIGLYLNTHPTDSEAIRTYNEVITAADAVRSKYEAVWGPLCSFRSYAEDTSQWQWKNDPWAWEARANVSLGRKECR